MRVSDPSTASATANVIVRVTNVNEAPAFGEDVPTVLRVRENADAPVITFGDDDSPVDADTFAVTDQDGADTTHAYSVTGDDREVLAFDSSDILGFMAGHEPDFKEQSSYSITVEARSGTGFRRRSSTLDVTIEVVDTEDVGEVSLSQRQPQEGITVHASVSDPDGGVSIKRWEWERSSEITVDDTGTPSAECRDDPGTPGIGVVGGWASVDGATSLSYTPTPADVGRCLRATAVYRDNIGEADEQAMEVAEAPAQSSKTANAAPEFVDQDLNSPGDQSDRTSRKVAENTKAGQSIGTPVSAFDEDGELLIYTLGWCGRCVLQHIEERRPAQDEGFPELRGQDRLRRGGDRHRPLGGRGQHTGNHQRHQRARPSAYNRNQLCALLREWHGPGSLLHGI